MDKECFIHVYGHQEQNAETFCIYLHMNNGNVGLDTCNESTSVPLAVILAVHRQRKTVSQTACTDLFHSEEGSERNLSSVSHFR